MGKFCFTFFIDTTSTTSLYKLLSDGWGCVARCPCRRHNLTGSGFLHRTGPHHISCTKHDTLRSKTHHTPAGLHCITQSAQPTSSCYTVTGSSLHLYSEPPEPESEPVGSKLTCLHFGPPWECSNSAPVWLCCLNAARHPDRRTSGYTQPASSGEPQDLHLKIIKTQLRLTCQLNNTCAI